MSKRQFQSLYAEGNNGGDFIQITDLKDGTIQLKSGNCCVKSIDAIVPVEFLSAILADTMIKHSYDINAVIDSFGWAEDFKTELKSKVKK